jgi:hypothetical protein
MSLEPAWWNWPIGHLRVIGVAAALGVAALLVGFLWTPQVEAIFPAELEARAITSGAPGRSSAVTSADFVFRPLFRADRRPAPATELIQDQVPVPAYLESENLLEDYRLLGVFSSGDQKGVIVSQGNKGRERRRVYVGEDMEGWVLTDVESRSASFNRGDGVSGKLVLAVASSLPALEAPAEARVSEEEEAAARRPARKEGPVTFDSIAESKREQAVARRKKEKNRTEEPADD